MDSPSWWYALAHRRAVHASLGTATLAYVGIGPIAATTVYRVRKLDNIARGRWLARMERTGAEDAQGTAARMKVAAKRSAVEA